MRLDYSGQDLGGHDFSGADLINANFRYANLYRANFNGACCNGAVFQEACLRSTTFERTSLVSTVLWDVLSPNQDVRGFKRDGLWIIAYASGEYNEIALEPGEEAVAKVFSVCPISLHHPGIHIYPTAKVCQYYNSSPIYRLRVQQKDFHSAHYNWRCKRALVEEQVA